MGYGGRHVRWRGNCETECWRRAAKNRRKSWLAKAQAMEGERVRKKRVQWAERMDETKGEGQEEMDWSRRQGEKTRWAVVDGEFHREGREACQDLGKHSD